MALYAFMFPQLIAGPIVRYSDVEREIENRKITVENIASGTERFIFGLGKKVLLADYLGWGADYIFSINGSMSGLTAWLGAILYTFQIYFDFSGYSDMAIGLGQLFGFTYPENFSHPYISVSVTDFWRRWHMTLSRWFKDYVYIPLGGNRVNKSRWAFNLLMVWLLTGLWHGANWTFVVWGVFYFVILILEKLYISKLIKNHKIIGHLYTMLCVICAWTIFRSDTLSGACVFLKRMFFLTGEGIIDASFLRLFKDTWIVLLMAFVLSKPIYTKVIDHLNRVNEKIANMFEMSVCLLVFGLSLLQVVGQTYSPFIYFNF
ncbi:MAG: MBOAT family protein [Eubacterium sp.]|nr:MBOAT family protein [Eubacterium sp.]